MRLAILMPVRDDWKSASVLIGQIDPILRSHSCVADVLLVDDDSNQPAAPGDFQAAYEAVQSVRSLRLRLNLGHQRAIAIGLAHIFEKVPCDAVLVMDADGEDTAEGVSRLLEAFRQNAGTVLIFAERSRRSESLLFRCLYGAYKILHYVLTGTKVRVGNFSIMPRHYLHTLVVQSDMWNHYAASVIRSRRPLRMVPIPRGKRLAGKSRMDYVALAIHGLSAIAVFGDLVGTRLLAAATAACLPLAAGVFLLAARGLFTHQTVPRWAFYLAATLAIVLFQLVCSAAIFTFLMLSNRKNLGFVPLRDYSWFVSEPVDIYPK